jgi:hypothetical protein
MNQGRSVRWRRIAFICGPSIVVLIAWLQSELYANHNQVIIRGPTATATTTPSPTRPSARPTGPTPTPLSFTRMPGVIEAELFDGGGEGTGYHDLDAANQGGAFRPGEGVDISAASDGGGYYVTSIGAGEWLGYRIAIPSGGDYTLQVRVASAGPGGTFHMEAMGADLTGPLTIPDTGGTEAWYTITRQVTLGSTLVQQVRFLFDANGPSGTVGQIHYFSLTKTRPRATPSPTLPPPGSTPTPTPTGMRTSVPSSWYTAIPGTFEAEHFETLHEDTGYYDVEPANLGGAFRPDEGVDIQVTSDIGGGYNIGWTKAGEWLEYAYGVSGQSGHYLLRVRVASAGPGGRFHLEANGTDITGPLTVPDTGSFQTWQTLSKTVALGSGYYKLRLVMDAAGPGGSVGNFNHFSFDPSSDTAPTPPRPTPTSTATPTPTPTRTPTATARTGVRPTARPRAVPTWQAWKWYAIGNLASYGGAHYRCIQAHTSQPDWAPPVVPALWQRQ